MAEKTKAKRWQNGSAQCCWIAISAGMLATPPADALPVLPDGGQVVMPGWFSGKCSAIAAYDSFDSQKGERDIPRASLSTGDPGIRTL